MTNLKRFIAVLLLTVLVGCGLNSVTKAELERVKAGDVITYRYQKDGKSWFYADRVTRVEGDKIYYNPSKSEATAGNDSRVKIFDTSRELSIAKADLLRYETEQGDERKVVIWID
jgi:hypothetical protein